MSTYASMVDSCGLHVETPPLTAYLPARGHATAGVIIAPGGAFVALAISREGTDVARWLQQHGIAAFVLKYRVLEKVGEGIPQMDYDTAARYGIADGIQALQVVRQHAAEWGVDSEKIGSWAFPLVAWWRAPRYCRTAPPCARHSAGRACICVRWAWVWGGAAGDGE